MGGSKEKVRRRFLVVSDTHIPVRATALPEPLLRALQSPGLEAVFHSGDLVEWAVYEELAAYAPVYAVHGNMDLPDVKKRLPWRTVAEVDGLRIGLTHGHLGGGATTPERARRTFAGEAVDVVLFGHSHQPYVETQDGVLLLNPGSATDRRREPQCSFAWLHVEGEAGGPPRLWAEHVYYDR